MVVLRRPAVAGLWMVQSERGQGALRRSVSVNLADAGTQGLRD